MTSKQQFPRHASSMRHARIRALSAVMAAMTCTSASAMERDSPNGLWMTAEKDAVIQFSACKEAPTALCGIVVWATDADQPSNSCGLRIAQLDRFADDAWRDGWVYDPREKRKYKGVLRLKSSDLLLRAFVGTEMLGQTERMSRVDKPPTSPACTLG